MFVKFRLFPPAMILTILASGCTSPGIDNFAQLKMFKAGDDGVTNRLFYILEKDLSTHIAPDAETAHKNHNTLTVDQVLFNNESADVFSYSVHLQRFNKAENSVISGTCNVHDVPKCADGIAKKLVSELDK